VRLCGVARRAKSDRLLRAMPGAATASEPMRIIVVRETSLRVLILTGCACGISDIVKRRSIRVVDRMARPRGCSMRHSLHYLRTVFGARSSQDDRVVKRFFQRSLTASLSVRSYEASWSF
jgi:hypothetical protein